MPAEKEPESIADGADSDYKALLEIEQAKSVALEADNDRMGRDLSSLRGTVRSQTARDAENTSRFNSLEKQIAAMGSAQASGDVSNLAESLTRIEQDSQADSQQRQFTDEFNEAYTDLNEALGTVSLDAPEAAEIKTMWLAAHKGDGMTDAQRIRQFNRAARMAGKLTPPKPVADPAPTPDPEPDPDPVGTDTGPGARGASQSLATLNQKDPRKMTPKQQQEHLAALHAEADKATGVKHKWE